MADHRRRGDRSRRDDDRYLFLEAICSARRCLYLSYVGRDLHDNGERPPSVLIAELLEVVQRGFGADIVVEHPLQPFSRSYFDGSHPRRISYSDELCTASAALGGNDTPQAPFLRSPLPPPGEEWLSLSLERFVQFFVHPSKFLLRERLGVRLDERETRLAPREPFVLDNLEAWQVRQAMLALQQRGVEPSLAGALLHGRGLLPHGAAGDVVMSTEWGRVVEFATRLAAHHRGAAPALLPVALEVAGVRLEGTLDGLLPDGRLEFRLGSLRASDRIAFWVRHLVLQLAAPAGVSRTSHWMGDGDALTLPPIPDAERHLTDLVACYRAGVCAPLESPINLGGRSTRLHMITKCVA